MACLPRTGVFFCRTLDFPFTDKEIQAYELELVNRASGQSAVRRHARASLCVVVVVVVVLVIIMCQRLILLRAHREISRDTIRRK